ncbi:MAG: SGNH/GDSL hydrolase family protein, partial [Nitrososphaerales archaeon]
MTRFEGGGPEGLEQTQNADTYVPETQLNSPAGVIKLSETLDGSTDESYVPPEYNWLSWSNGFQGEVYWNGNGNNGESSYFPEDTQPGVVPLLATPHTLKITFPAGVRGFYTYVEPYPDSDPEVPPNYAHVSVSAAPGDGEVGPVTVQGFHGATYFGCYDKAGLSSISVSSDSPWGFAIGELGIAAVKYVALGDSFSSGEGNPPFIDETACHRSELAYPELLEHGVLENLPLAFVACSGATTVTGQNQFESLTNETKVVTVTFGGDNLGFANILKYCLILGCPESEGLGIKAMQNIPERIAALKSTLVADYQEILADAPNAAVYVLGYPYIFPPHPGKLQFCLKKGFMFPGDLSRLAAWETQLDEVIREAVAASGANVTYVEPNNLFAGHDVCSQSTWFNPIGSWFTNGHHVEYLFHPNAAGQSALEESLIEAGIESYADDALGHTPARTAAAVTAPGVRQPNHTAQPA